MEIVRAHRTGTKHAPGATREDGSAFGPRAMVIKFKSWKQKEAVLRIARNKKLDGLYFHPDLAERTLQRRRSQVPEMLRARKEGKTAYIIRDKLVISEKNYFTPAAQEVQDQISKQLTLALKMLKMKLKSVLAK